MTGIRMQKQIRNTGMEIWLWKGNTDRIYRRYERIKNYESGELTDRKTGGNPGI